MECMKNIEPVGCYHLPLTFTDKASIGDVDVQRKVLLKCGKSGIWRQFEKDNDE